MDNFHNPADEEAHPVPAEAQRGKYELWCKAMARSVISAGILQLFSKLRIGRSGQPL